MITRIRIVGVRPGRLDDYKENARAWRNLLHKNGGRVLGFYFNEADNTVTGIAEYESRERLAEIQEECEKDAAFPAIRERGKELQVSLEELILDKLDSLVERPLCGE